jgi:hypothetical protein
MIKNYFNIEGLADRIRTCRQEEKSELWHDMKILGNGGHIFVCRNVILVFARLMVSVYLIYTIKIISRAEMVLIAKKLSKNHSLKDETDFEKCRLFLDEVKGFYAILVAEICPAMIEVCKNILEFINLDFKIEDLDSIKTIMMQLKNRSDASFSM